MASRTGPTQIVGGALRLHLRVTPKASANKIEGLAETADGSQVLKIRVTAVPERGKANKAVIKLVAKALGVAPGTLSVIAGETSRNKTLALEGDPAFLEQKIHTFLEGI